MTEEPGAAVEASTERIFLCRGCGYRDNAVVFGDAVCCPRCRSTNVVLAVLWERFANDRRMDVETGSSGMEH